MRLLFGGDASADLRMLAVDGDASRPEFVGVDQLREDVGRLIGRDSVKRVVAVDDDDGVVHVLNVLDFEIYCKDYSSKTYDQ